MKHILKYDKISEAKSESNIEQIFNEARREAMTIIKNLFNKVEKYSDQDVNHPEYTYPYFYQDSTNFLQTEHKKKLDDISYIGYIEKFKCYVLFRKNYYREVIGFGKLRISSDFKSFELHNTDSYGLIEKIGDNFKGSYFINGYKSSKDKIKSFNKSGIDVNEILEITGKEITSKFKNLIYEVKPKIECLYIFDDIKNITDEYPLEQLLKELNYISDNYSKQFLIVCKISTMYSKFFVRLKIKNNSNDFDIE